MAATPPKSPPGSLEKKLFGDNDIDLSALARGALNESEFAFVLKDIARASNCEKRTAYRKASRLYSRARDGLSVVSEEKKTPLMQDLLQHLEKRAAVLASHPLATTESEQDEMPSESPRIPATQQLNGAGDDLRSPATQVPAAAAAASPSTSSEEPPTTRTERIPSVGSRGVVARPSLKTAFLRPDLRASRPHVLIAKSAGLTVKPDLPTSSSGESSPGTTATTTTTTTTTTAVVATSVSTTSTASTASSSPSSSPNASQAIAVEPVAKPDVASVIEFKPAPGHKSWVELLQQTAKRKQHHSEEKLSDTPAKPILMVDPAAKKRRATMTTKLHVRFLEEATLCLFAPQSPPKAIRQADDAAEEDYFSRHLEEPNEQQLTAIYEQALLCVLCPLNANLPLLAGQTVPEKARSEHFIRLLRSCFAVTTQQHELYLSAVQNVSNPGYILAGLRTQYEALDNHIFYAKINYEPQDAPFVDIWRERERVRLGGLITKLVEDHPSLANASGDGRRMSRSVMFSPLQNFHDLYKILLSCLYLYEMNQPPTEVDPKTLLSRHSLWLLDEYARRYSIAPLYRKIVFLNILAFEGFESMLNRIWLVHETLKEVIELLKAGEKMNLVERHVFTSLVDKLHLEVKSKLSKVFSRYNALSPLVSVRLNIGILEMLSQVDAMMQGQGTTSCADLLYEYTRVALANRYQQLLVYESDSDAREQQKTRKAHKEEHIIATPSQLVEVCNLILASAKVAKEFRPLYKDYFDIVPLVQLGYVNFFTENVQTFCKYYCFSYPPSEVLDLCGKIKQINKRFQRKLPSFEPIPLTLFAPFVYSWIGETHQRLIKTGAEFCRAHKWQPEENNKYPAALDSFLHMCGEPISFLHDQAYFDPCSEPEKKDSFLHRYGKAVTKSIAIFIEQIYNSFLDVLPSEDKRELRETFNIKEDKPQVAKVSALMKNSRDCARITKNKRNEILPAEFFVRLSSLERIEVFLEELSGRLPNGAELVADVSKTLRRAISTVTGMIIYWLEANVSARASEFMQEKSVPKVPKSKLQPTFDYIFQQISVMSILCDKTFKAILTRWWDRTSQFLHAILLNQAIGADSKTAKAGSISIKLAEQFLEEHKSLFVANGRGIPLATVDKQIEKLFQQIKAVSKFTEPSVSRNSSKGQEG